MKLLIIKSGQDYIRFKDDKYLPVSIDKASVFPLSRINVVQTHATQLREQGFENVGIKKLVLTEEDLSS
jgi:rhodanese-related sulfurtransferase